MGEDNRPSSGTVAEHYERTDSIVEALVGAIESSGLDSNDAANFAGAEEFHLGGRSTADALIADLALDAAGVHLDVGCGIGGTARRIAASVGCRVVGVDLTPRFVEAARQLSDRVGLGALTDFRVADAAKLAMPADTFASASLLHVGMNVADKPALVAGVARALAPGGRFAIFDVMRVSDGVLSYPMPWATDPANSHVESPENYQHHLTQGGFTVESVVDRTEMAMTAAAAAAENPPPVHLGHLMGRDFGSMIANLLPAVKAGTLAPIQIVARRND
jgi:SAM-dependent methyltransferase